MAPNDVRPTQQRPAGGDWYPRDGQCGVYTGNPSRRCTEPSALLTFGDPCPVCEWHGDPECRGHAVCEFHGADLRAKQYPAFRAQEDSPPYVPARICSIPVAS